MKQCKNLEGIHKIQFFCSSSSIFFSSPFCPQAIWMTQNILDLQSFTNMRHPPTTLSTSSGSRERVEPCVPSGEVRDSRRPLIVLFSFGCGCIFSTNRNLHFMHTTIGLDTFCFLKLPLATWNWFSSHLTVQVSTSSPCSTHEVNSSPKSSALSERMWESHFDFCIIH